MGWPPAVVIVVRYALPLLISSLESLGFIRVPLKRMLEIDLIRLADMVPDLMLLISNGILLRRLRMILLLPMAAGINPKPLELE